MVTADAVVINCPQGCVLQMAALPHSPLGKIKFYLLYLKMASKFFPNVYSLISSVNYIFLKVTDANKFEIKTERVSFNYLV